MKQSKMFTRRQTLSSIGAMGLGAATLGGMAGRAYAQNLPQNGGILTVSTSGDPPNLDIFSNTTSRTLKVVGPCYNGLVMLNPADPSEIIGDLATSWEASEDGRAITFTIVTNAKFHDGVALTSADVKHTFDLMRDPPGDMVSLRKDSLSIVESIEAPDDYTVVFRLKQASPSFLTTLTNPWCLVAPKHVLEKHGNTKDVLIGSGPFMLKSQSKGVSIELVRNPDYHVPERPYLDGITVYVVPDRGTAALYLRSGQLKIDIDMPPSIALGLQRDAPDAVNVMSATAYNGDCFVMNANRAPFNDIRVRKAIALSTDHEDALNVIYNGAGAVAGFMPPGQWSLSDDVLRQQPGYGGDIEANRAEARRLLEEAGLGDGFKTVLTGRKNAGTHEERVVYLADQFRKIGITAEINLEETAQYLEIMEKRNFDVATSLISTTANDPDFLLAPYHTCEGTENYSGICNDVVDTLYTEQTTTMDFAARKALVNQIEVAALNDFGFVNLYFKNKFVSAHKSVQGYIMTNEPDNNMRFQDVWLS